MLSSCHRKSPKTASGSRVTSHTKTPSHPNSKRRSSECWHALLPWSGNWKIILRAAKLFFLQDTTETSWKPPISCDRKAQRYDLGYINSPLSSLAVRGDSWFHWLLAAASQMRIRFTSPTSPQVAWSCTGATQSPSSSSTLRSPWRVCVTMLWYWRPTCRARSWRWTTSTVLRHITPWSLPAPKTVKLFPPVKASWPPVSSETKPPSNLSDLSHGRVNYNCGLTVHQIRLHDWCFLWQSLQIPDQCTSPPGAVWAMLNEGSNQPLVSDCTVGLCLFW